ncbi:GNAT family N-acetyltransferase [Corynebacterium sp. sy039]|uniref:GNAT family N-acetyltransferase n=1 Tax=Corynebacterium sp. sy039 TaxID=2599641 RepID=UPI0011B567EF|nr:GNAT family N-acetyltransferase [Corynebacterium sp. sy039]QDZ42169.1 N-acetyltransferase [Corynebacterium sp. sy039]
MSIHTAVHESKSRFEIFVDDTLAGYVTFLEDEQRKTRNFNHTLVKEKYQGQGLSKPLIRFALDHTRADGYGVIATCSAVAAFIQKNPEYQDLLVQH